MKKSKIVLTLLATACALTLSACDNTGKPSNSPFYNDDNKASPAPSNIMPSIMPSTSPDLEPDNSPGNNPPDLIPNPTEDENPDNG